MIKRYTLAMIGLCIIAALLCQPAAAKEDTAQISLKKTAVSKQNLRNYTVKKGDVISAIIRKIPGITQEDIPDNYRIIKDLNPDIKNLNKLSVGQILVLPGKGNDTAAEKSDEASAAIQPNQASSADSQAYTIKKGDSLIKIIHRELKIKVDTFKSLQLIKSLNPHIVNVNKIYTGQIIKLPGKTVFVRAPEEIKTIEQTVIKPAESQPQTEKIIELTEKKVMSPEARLAVIKQVVTQMNGSLMSSGNYYLPIPKTGQVTIDCSKIPLIEFDDKTTIFLDMENRLNDNLKKMIRDSWSNFHSVKVDKKDDTIAILRKIITVTKSFSMTKRETPLTVGNLPPVKIIVDWMIVRSDPKQIRPIMHGLRLVPEGNALLPKAIKNYAQKNGLIITEIDEETGLAGQPEEIYSLPPLTVFPVTSAKDFTYALVTNLGFAARKDDEVKVFDMVKDGFNLSIKADVLIKNADKQYIVYSRNMPEQFITVLKEAGNELIFIADADSPKVKLEKILRGLTIQYSSGNFTFSGADKNQAPYTLSFAATRITGSKDMYIVDFDIDQGIRGLLSESWSVNIARY